MNKRTNTAVWHEKYKRWQINVQKDGIRRSFYSSIPGRKGQRECNAKADRFLDDNIIEDIRVNKLCDLWLEEIKDTTSTGHYINNESYARNWIIPIIGHKKISYVAEQDLQTILNKAYKNGKSKKTISNIRGSITSLIKFARKSNLTKLYPEDLKIPDKAPEKEKRILQPKDLDILFSMDNDDWYINAYRLLVVTGLRKGELIPIQIKRDIIDNTLYIRESFNKYKEFTDGKSKNAIRVLALNELSHSIIKDQIEKLNRSNMKSVYLFPNTYGNITQSAMIYKHWLKFRDKAGIQKVSLHELRHTFISMCKEVPLELLKPVVGHSANMDTFKQYGHEIDGEKERASQMIYNELRKYIKT